MTAIKQAGRPIPGAARFNLAALGRVASVASLVGFVLCAGPAMATETFGPGEVSCEVLGGAEEDCLLSASRITADNRNEASFSLAALPPGEQALFRKWCVHPDDECTVTIQGQRESPEGTRLSAVTSLQWHRPRAPRDAAAAAR